MKNKYIIIIISIILLSNQNAFSEDFYPELGRDPFYSSLNPSYIDEDADTGKDISIFDWFKNRKKNSEEVNENQTDNIVKTEVKNDDNKDENQDKKWFIFNKKESDESDEVIEQKPKRKLTKRELERELIKEEREKQRELEKAQKQANEQTVGQGKRLTIKERLNLIKQAKEEKLAEEKINSNPSIELTADTMEYYPDMYEVEAVGNAKIYFREQDTILTANKIIFNYDRNIIKASENVLLISKDSTTEGDYLKIDLNRSDGWIQNPVTQNEDIKITAKEAFIYQDKIIESEGSAKLSKDDVLYLGSSSFAGIVDQGRVFSNNNFQADKQDIKGIYTIKARTILIDSKEEHDNITIKNADVYLKNHKIAVIPSLKIVTNKQRENVETNLPEFGSASMLGPHIGPAVVLNVPGGSTLKIAPILTYADSELGIGAIARFRSKNNMTEFAYGSSKDEILLRGRHKIAPGLLFTYSRYTNQNEWFLGYRMPQYSAQLSYSRSDWVKDLKLNFSQLYSAGAFVDRPDRYDLSDAEGRFRWMTQTFKPVYSYSNDEANVGIRVGLVAQTAATVYTTGDTVGLLRVGPSLSTNLGPWKQSLLYFQTASAGRSPFYFDYYRYGRSNLVLIESLKLCKYISIGYLGSVAMNKDYPKDDTFQENRFLISVGPDYAKVTLGYDSIRHNTMFLFSMLVGTKDSEVEFKKTIINDPSKLGNGKSKQKKPKKKNYKKYLNDKVPIIPS